VSGYVTADIAANTFEHLSGINRLIRVSYKRNQVEEAIAGIFAPNCERPPSELRSRIKRLLDLDPSIGRKLRSKDAEEANFGFSAEAPGSGADVSSSEYEAYALLNALRIVN
jgi:hypothetical protein